MRSLDTNKRPKISNTYYINCTVFALSIFQVAIHEVSILFGSFGSLNEKIVENIKGKECVKTSFLLPSPFRQTGNGIFFRHMSGTNRRIEAGPFLS